MSITIDRIEKEDANWWAVYVSGVKDPEKLYDDYALEARCSDLLSTRNDDVLFLGRDGNNVRVLFFANICADELQALSLFYKILPLIQEKYPHEF